MLGLFGVMMAGLAADALIGHRSDDEEVEDLPPEEDEGSLADGNLLDDIAGDPTIPTSDDLPDTMDRSVTVHGTEKADLLDGFGGNDEIDGGEGSDLINGRGGDDDIDGAAGNDAIWAGHGHDSVWGGDGNDSVLGEQGNDAIFGGAGKDSLAGCDGDDSLSGGADKDTLLGGAGNDWQDGGDGDDWLLGSDGNDSLIGGAGSDELDGGAGQDTLSGVETEGPQETDFINGGTGDDRLVLGAGDIGTGGEGKDEFVLQEWLTEGQVVRIEDYDPGEDQLVIVYDASVHTEPVLTVEPDETGTSQSIYIDGSKVAVVTGAPVNADGIRLVAA